VADSSHDLAWAAGLFEGEGYVEHRPNGCGRTTRGLGLAMTDLDVVERFQKVVGVGAVRGPYTNRRNKPLYVWKVWRVNSSRSWGRGGVKRSSHSSTIPRFASWGRASDAAAR
jgi:hypothetical protein